MTIPVVSNGIKELFTKGGHKMFVDWLNDFVKGDGVPNAYHDTDDRAKPNSFYYSNTAGKLVYKDGAGVVHSLY